MRVRTGKRTLTILLMIGLAPALAACAGGGAGGGESGPRADPDVLTSGELAEYTFPSVYEAVRRLRPRWLQSRAGGTPQAILDGTRLGSTDQLRSINVGDVLTIRYMSASDATTRYGTGFPDGAIEVRTR